MTFTIRVISLILIIAVLTISAGCTQTPRNVTIIPVSPTAPPSPTKEDLVAFVKEAVAYAKANGKEKALAEFDKRNGSFFKESRYIYAYDYNGTTIAHPVNPEKIGVNRLNETDVYGNLFIKNLREAAYNGSGFSEYYYINPLHNNAIEKKLGYVEKVDDYWWLGSGILRGTLTGNGFPHGDRRDRSYRNDGPGGRGIRTAGNIPRMTPNLKNALRVYFIRRKYLYGSQERAKRGSPDLFCERRDLMPSVHNSWIPGRVRRSMTMTGNSWSTFPGQRISAAAGSGCSTA